jgi:hypothetical protein
MPALEHQRAARAPHAEVLERDAGRHEREQHEGPIGNLAGVEGESPDRHRATFGRERPEPLRAGRVDGIESGERRVFRRHDEDRHRRLGWRRRRDRRQRNAWPQEPHEQRDQAGVTRGRSGKRRDIAAQHALD